MAIKLFYSNEELNDGLVKDLDNTLTDLVKDADKNIRYIKVISQEDYNKEEISNNTLYFINDIYDTVFDVTNILDVAISHTSNLSDQPDQLWVLTADTEMEEVNLWVGKVKGSEFKLIKNYKGFVDGRLTFDGVYEYIKGNNKSSLLTKNEPFVVLINAMGELYAFPSLKYKVNGTGETQAWHIDGSFEEKVTVCSVEKGYCSELFKGDDQGIVIAYVKQVTGGYKLYYTQYGYPSDDATVKAPSGVLVPVFDEPIAGAIFSVAVRRLSDYRLGLTYNYWDGDVAKAEFRYSDRTYSGIAFHPEYIDINEIPGVGPLLYGAVRNDNITRVELPALVAAEVPEVKQGNIKIIFELYSEDPNGDNVTEKPKKINIQILNNSDPNATYYEAKEELEVGLKVINTFPYMNYSTTRDPYYGDNTHAKAVIASIKSSDNKIIVELVGDNLPMTPFSIVPDTERNDKINIRYVGSDFNKVDDSIQIQGWFALDNLIGSEIGAVHSTPLADPSHAYIPVYTTGTALGFETTMFKSSTIMENVTFYAYIDIGYNALDNSITLAPSILNSAGSFANIISVKEMESSFLMECYGGTNINV